MASERKLWEQTRFDGGIAQSPFYGSANQVADAGDLDVLSVLGEVALSPEVLQNRRGADAGSVGLDEWFSGSLLDENGVEVFLFSNLSYRKRLDDNETVTLDAGLADDEYLILLYAGYSRVLDSNIIIAKKSDQDGFNIYTPKDGSQAEIEKVLKVDPADNLKGVGKETISIDISVVESDGAMFLGLANEIWRISSASSGFLVENALTLPSNHVIQKITKYGTNFRIYTQVFDGEVLGLSDGTISNGFLFFWDRRTDAYSTVLEVPGLFIDVATVNSIDYIITDRVVGYFSGDVFVVLRKIPSPSEGIEVPISGTAASTENFLVFATTKIDTAHIRSAGKDSEIEGSSLSLWTYGSPQSNNASSLQRYDDVHFGIPRYFGQNEFALITGTDIVRNVSLSVQKKYVQPRKNIAARFGNGVRFFLAGNRDRQTSQDPRDARFSSFVLPIYPENVLFYNRRGSFETLAVGNETNSIKLLENVSINASIPEKCSVEVSVRRDGKDFGDAVIFSPSKELSQTKVHDGIVEFTFLQFRIVLRGNGSTTPRLYSIGCQFSSREII